MVIRPFPYYHMPFRLLTCSVQDLLRSLAAAKEVIRFGNISRIPRSQLSRCLGSWVTMPKLIRNGQCGTHWLK